MAAARRRGRRERFVFLEEQWIAVDKIVRDSGGRKVTRSAIENLINFHQNAMAIAAKMPKVTSREASAGKNALRALKVLDCYGCSPPKELQKLVRLIPTDRRTAATWGASAYRGARNCLWLSLALFWKNEVGLEVKIGEFSSAIQFIVELPARL